MTMFPMLDDPHPPVATHHTLTRVHTRARILRRRRRMVAAAPALLAVGVAGAIAPRFRSESPQEVATITSSTLPPSTGFGVTTTLPYDDRGEVFRLTELPAGWELWEERNNQMPEVRLFDRTMGLRLRNDVDPADPADPYDYASIHRYEGSAADETLLRSSLLDGGEVRTTPGGREVIRSVGGGSESLTWFPAAGVWIQASASVDQGLDLEAVIDDLDYAAPSPSCFDGEDVRTDVAACGPLEYLAP